MVSIVDNLFFLYLRRFLSQATPCLPHCENQNHYCLTDYQLHKSCDFQTWYTFFCSNSYRFNTYNPDIPICHCVYEVHGLWMSWQFPLFFFEFADQPIMKPLSVNHSPRTVCAFVSLTIDDILQQYTFLVTPSPNFIRTVSYCCFEKFRIKCTVSLDFYHPWSATNSASSFPFQPVSFGQWNVVG